MVNVPLPTLIVSVLFVPLHAPLTMLLLPPDEVIVPFEAMFSGVRISRLARAAERHVAAIELQRAGTRAAAGAESHRAGVQGESAGECVRVVDRQRTGARFDERHRPDEAAGAAERVALGGVHRHRIRLQRADEGDRSVV